MSEFSVCTFVDFLCFARNNPASAEGGFGMPCALDSGFLVGLPSGVRKNLN